MSTKQVAPVVTREVKANVSEDETIVIVHADVDKFVQSAFEMQDDFESASKFARVFLFDACREQLLKSARTAISRWDAVINKMSKRHPSDTREQCEAKALENKKLRALHDYAVAGAEIKQRLG